MSLFQRLWDTLGLSEPIEEEYDDPTPEAGAAIEWQEGAEAIDRPPPGKIVGMSGRNVGQSEVLLMEPRSFAEIPQAVTALKQRKTVILNLSLVDADTAQRCVDFVAGGAFALDGRQERVGETVFLFTPSSVQVSSYVTQPPPPAEAAIAPRRPLSTTPAWSGELHELR
jgi:cell division inhibitor SepF